MLTDRMGIDIWEVVDAAATKPYGFMRFEPGPGMGGGCPQCAIICYPT
jgi:UDP-N-acetyl-D-glucosamine dehydrogenase